MALSIVGLLAVASSRLALRAPTPGVAISVVDLMWAVIAVCTIGYIGLAVFHPELLW